MLDYQRVRNTLHGFAALKVLKVKLLAGNQQITRHNTCVPSVELPACCVPSPLLYQLFLCNREVWRVELFKREHEGGQPLHLKLESDQTRHFGSSSSRLVISMMISICLCRKVVFDSIWCAGPKYWEKMIEFCLTHYLYSLYGWWFRTFGLFSIDWKESSQLTNSYFSEG